MPRADLRTPANKDFGKPGVSFPWGNMAYPTVTEQHDENRSATRKPFLQAYNGAGSNFISALLTGVSVSEGDSQNVNVSYRWETLPGPELIRKGYDLDTGAMTRVVRQKVSLPTYPTANGATRVFPINGSGGTASFVSQDSYVDPIDDITGWLVTTYQVIPTELITVYDQDEETLVNVRTTYRVVGYPITPPTPTTGIIINYKKIDSQKALEITRDFTAFLAYSYTEQRFSADTFPALFDYTQYEWSDACGAFSQIRASFSTSVQTTTVITYDSSPQAIAGLTLIPKTLQLGRGVQISADVLVDSGNFIYSGTCTGTVTFGASSPDYSTYVGSIMGSSQLKAGESVLWKARIWRTTRVYQQYL